MTRFWEVSQIESPLLYFTIGTESQKESVEMAPKDKDKKEEEVEETDVEETEVEETAEETSEEESTEEEQGLTVEELRARLKEKEDRLREVNRESKDRRLALEKLEKEKKDREEAELSEKERLEKRASEAESELEKTRKEARDLKLSNEFGKTARALKLEFVSDTAREDALRLLDLEKIGEDFEGLEDALKDLSKDRPYLFGKLDPNQIINDGSRKNRNNASLTTRKAVEQKKRRIAPL